MQAPLETPVGSQGSQRGMRLEEEKKQDYQTMTRIASNLEPDSAAPNEGSLTLQNNEQ